MVFLRLKPEVRNFFADYMCSGKDNVLFYYRWENQVVAQEHWSGNGLRIPVSKGMWLVADGLPVSITNLFIGHSASDLMCFCHYYPNWVNPLCLSAFASLGLLPTKEQFNWLNSLFPNATIHTVFDGGLSGRVADCKVAMWLLGKHVRFRLGNDHIEFYCNKKKYRIPIVIFSLSRFEKLCGVRANIRTHKPIARFDTFYQSFTIEVI